MRVTRRAVLRGAALLCAPAILCRPARAAAPIDIEPIVAAALAAVAAARIAPG